MTRARFVIIMTIVGLLLAMLPMQAALGQPAAAKKNLTVAIDNDEGLLTPMNWNTWVGYYLMNYVYDTLLNRDLKSQPAPGVAKSYTVSSDGLVYSLVLRDDVTWHDGKKLTAEDVVFTYEATAKRRPGQMTPIASIKATGEYAVEIVLKSITPFFTSDVLMDVPLMPKHIWQNVEIKNERTPFAGAVGSGPFKLKEMKAGEYYSLEANTTYWGGRPLVDALVAKIIKDRAAQFQALKVGEVDAVVVSIPSTLVGELEQTSGVGVIKGSDFFNYVLKINIERPPFDKLDARRAVALAIDQSKLVELVLQGRGTVLPPSYYHPDLPYARTDLKWEFNPAKAKQLLDNLGVKDTNGDGLREVGGKNIERQLLCDSNNPAEVRTAEMMKTWLKEIGIGITPRCLDVDTVMSFVWPKFNAKNGRDFDLSLFAWSAGPQTRRSYVRAMVHSDIQNFGGSNVTAYGSPEMDKLVDTLIVTTDPAQQNELQKQIGGKIAADLPFIALFSPSGAFAYRPDSYNQWAYMEGIGILPRTSFLPGYASAGAAGAPSATGSQQGLFVLGFLALLAIFILGIAYNRRGPKDGQAEAKPGEPSH